MIVFNLIKILILFICVLVAVAFFTVAERKIIGSIQRRRGPNVIGFFGLFQALADGLKLLLKESIIPSSSNKNLFLIAPVITFFLSLVGWSVIPIKLNTVYADINLSTLFILAVSSLGVYGIIISGWSSNSKYAFLGALRSAAQIISYEVSISFIIVSIIICAGSFNLSEIVFAQRNVWFCFPLFPLFIIFFISALAETNRHPFDLPEAEAELVSGYNVEYSSIGFALFFLGEYSNIILISVVTTLFFLGGWSFPIAVFEGSLCLSLKSFVFICLFIWTRAAFPRYRYDQLIRLGWKVFLPFSISWILFTSGMLLGINWLPLKKKIKMIKLSYFLTVSTTSFLLALFGILLNRRSILLNLLCIELILLSVNINFVIFSVYLDDNVGQIFTLFVLAVAAAESAIGLALLVIYFRVHNTLSIYSINLLQG